jgi:predicted pyridoxine 5'-phosphate oxidase superfamily flavin-nucleotide-binding protein
MTDSLSIADVARCFEGAVPAVIATAAADGVPNVTYLSRVQRVDDERVALSNQFFSKTARNLAENPRASVLLVDPSTYDQYRLELRYERTERRGPVFERLRADVDTLAALEGMQHVFKLRSADIYRVLHIEPTASGRRRLDGSTSAPDARPVPDPTALAELAGRLSRATDLDAVVGATMAGLADLFGYEHAMLLLLDEVGQRLFTIASAGYDHEGVGSEVEVGTGVIGMAAARCASVRVGNLNQMRKYSRTVRRSYEGSGALVPMEDAIPLPDLPGGQSRVAVPAMALGQLVGVLTVESRRPVAFTEADEATLTIVASLVAAAVEAERTADQPLVQAAPASGGPPAPTGRATRVRFYEADGSTFIDGEYLIKGVAGRLLWALLGQHQHEGRVEFTNREMRLDPTLELPPYRDNFDSRLILLKRRLDEREAPVRIEKCGRGCFRLDVDGPVLLELA